MAKNKRGRTYRLTPRRKAALAKAQAASARKRKGRSRRRGIVVAGALGATLAVGGVGYHQYRKGQQKRRQQTILDSLPKPQLALPAGSSHITVLKMGDIGVRKRSKPKPEKKKIFKVDSKGVVTKTRLNAENSKARQAHNDRRRMEYWKNKPVAPQPVTISTRRQRMKRK